jgi:peptidoglycan/xylan/chitin deacetylase (PgdA/CDA1 family)
MDMVEEKPKHKMVEEQEEWPIEYYLHERYKGNKKKSAILKLYYVLRPLIPRSLQLMMRRRYARKQAQITFPAWPIEPILVDRANRDLKRLIEQSDEQRIPVLNFWPGNSCAAVILTHDVEWDYGVRNIPRVRDVEKKYGVVSSWNFVPERYHFDKKIFKTLEDEGCEVGVHGLYHDGKLFSSRTIFKERLPKINAYIKGWNAAGFRSPATHRNPDWMPELAAEYDSSFPDTDPFEPQAGGCCSIFPFFLRNMVELPITLPQDHTLFEILKVNDIEIWKKKSAWIIENHGLVNTIIHPDYMLTEKDLSHYDEFLKFITSYQNLWFALPRDVARWWRDRADSEVVALDGIQPIIKGPAAERGRVAWASLQGENVVYTFEHQ